MRRHAILVLAMMAVLLVLFAVVRAADVAVLEDPRPVLVGLGTLAALAAVGLQIVDVLLPVPSSVIMVWLGASYGWLAGATLSLLGGIGATVFAFWVGRKGGPLYARLVAHDDRVRADSFLQRWGLVAIALTRPIPIVAETTAIVAGTSPGVTWRGVLVAATVGCAPWAVAYGVAGAALAG